MNERLHPYKFTVKKDGEIQYHFGTEKGVKSCNYDAIIKQEENPEEESDKNNKQQTTNPHAHLPRSPKTSQRSN